MLSPFFVIYWVVYKLNCFAIGREQFTIEVVNRRVSDAASVDKPQSTISFDLQLSI